MRSRAEAVIQDIDDIDLTDFIEITKWLMVLFSLSDLLFAINIFDDKCAAIDH